MYVTITSDKVMRCVAMDGQGFSQEFVDKYWAEINANRNAQIIQISEDESATMLHEFATFVIHNASEDDKALIISYVSGLLAMTFGDGADIDAILDYALSDTEALTTVLAYLVKYMDEYDLDAEDIDKLLEMLGLNHLNSMINIGKIDFLGYKRQINLNLANILNIIKNNLTDDDDDWFITNIILPAIEKAFLEDYDIDISSVWEKINDKVRKIDASKGNGNATVKTGVIRDFSCSVYDALMRVINQINDSSVPVSAWNGYATEEWYSSLFVSLAVQGIHAYFSKLAETNNECKSKIEMIFQNVKSSDYSHSVFIDQNRRLINNVISKVHL